MSAVEQGATSAAVLETIKTAQAQNGLRHSDYSRYRQYCARRLRRLRTGKTVNWTYGKGKKYVQKEMKPDDVKSARHLAIILFNAERAWAGAQEVKQAAGSGDNIGAVARAHMLSRFKKAAAWAEKLEKLASLRADARTALEAEAYACFHAGNLAVELEVWEEGLLQFATARRISEQLASVAPKRARQLYDDRIVEIQPLERFCKYNMSRATGAAGGIGSIPDPVVDTPVLRAKIAEALAQTLAARFDGVTTVYWRGSIVPVRSDRARAALNEARLVMTVAGQGLAAQVETLTRYFEDGARAAHADGAAAAREGKDAIAVDFKSLEDYCRFMKLRAQLDKAIEAGSAEKLKEELASQAQSDRGSSKKGSPAGSDAPLNAWSASPYHVALDKAFGGSAKGKAGKGSTGATSLSALSRAVCILDDLSSLVGGRLAPHRARDSAQSQVGGGGGENDEGVISVLPKPPADADVETLTCLFARQASVLAWRCWAAASCLVTSQRYGDAAALLAHTRTRAQAALRAYACLTSGEAALQGAMRLPPVPVLPGTPEAESPDVPLAFVLTGVSGSEVSSLHVLLAMVDARGVAIQAGSLLERMAPHLRADAPLVQLYSTAMSAEGLSKSGAPAPAPLLRATARPAWLSRREAGISLSEPTDSAGFVCPFPPALLPVPAKPFLLDLAFNGVKYPESIQYGADALESEATAQAEAGGKADGQGGGLLSWLTGR